MSLKGLAWKEHLIDLLKGEQFEGAVAKYNPHNTVPVLIDGSRVLTQSLAIIEYINDVHPQPPLLPSDPFHRAEVRAFSLIAIADCHSMVVPRVRKRLSDQFEAEVGDVEEWINHWQTIALAAMERHLLERETRSNFCFGDAPSLADICLAAHIAGCQNSGTPFEQFESITEISQRLNEMDAFSANHPWVVRDQGPRAD